MDPLTMMEVARSRRDHLQRHADQRRLLDRRRPRTADDRGAGPRSDTGARPVVAVVLAATRRLVPHGG